MFIYIYRYRRPNRGGIDGYSRIVTHLVVASNNRTITAQTAFFTGVREYGLPSRGRTDKGGENVGIGRLMLTYRGVYRGSFMTGCSTRNQRIERLWRDVNNSWVSVFQRIFGHFALVFSLVILVGKWKKLADWTWTVKWTWSWSFSAIYLSIVQIHLNEFRRSWQSVS